MADEFYGAFDEECLVNADNPARKADYRSVYHQDRDRILFTPAFRRLQTKTQVFQAGEYDFYRTRLTHSLEVARLAESIAIWLRRENPEVRIDLHLLEAVCLAHDIGHPPFGHAGERVLDRLVPGGFSHYEQSLRIVDVLENDGRGLNLTWEVRDGIAKHSKGKSGAPVGMPPALRSATIEGQIMRVADLIAYVNHDIDDATRAGLLEPDDLPRAAVAALGSTSSSRIATLVKDVVTETLAGGLAEIRMSAPVLDAVLKLREFLFDAVYENTAATAEFKKATDVLSGLWEKVRERPAEFLDARTIEAEGLDVATRDFLAGMTDRYAVRLYEQLFIPKPWAIE